MSDGLFSPALIDSTSRCPGDLRLQTTEKNSEPVQFGNLLIEARARHSTLGSTSKRVLLSTEAALLPPSCHLPSSLKGATGNL